MCAAPASGRHVRTAPRAACEALPPALLRLHRDSRVHVLVVGGSEAARAAVAHAFHDASPLRRGPFLRVDCASQSAVLDHALRCWLSAIDRRSASNPLRMAERGTLFLDRIDEAGAATQRCLFAFVRALSADAIPDWAGRLVAGSSRAPALDADGGRLHPALLDCLDKVRVDLTGRSREEAA